MFNDMLKSLHLSEQSAQIEGFEMPTKGFITIGDFSKEKSTIYFNLPEITAANFSSVTQDLDEIRDALAAVVTGEIRAVGFTRTYNDDTISTATVTDTDADRETKLRVTLMDVKGWLDALGTIRNPNYGKLFSIEIPTFDKSLRKAGSDEVDYTVGGGLALAQAIEANVKSKDNRDAPTIVTDPDYVRVVGMKIVGRNI